MTQISRRTALRLAASAAALPLASTMVRADAHTTEHTVVISNFAFTPADLQIKAGDTVTWVNQGPSQHSAWESTNNTFDTGLLAAGQQASLTFNAAGTYNYRCRPHANMRGTITIS